MKRFKSLAAALLVASLAPSAITAKDKADWPDCYCTDSTGERVEMGQLACLSVGSRNFMARCEMSLNNPIWRDTGQICPMS